jgi:hypothetical protein
MPPSGAAVEQDHLVTGQQEMPGNRAARPASCRPWRNLEIAELLAQGRANQ